MTAIVNKTSEPDSGVEEKVEQPSESVVESDDTSPTSAVEEVPKLRVDEPREVMLTQPNSTLQSVEI